eukprot:84236-Chlamydomonas_euryale.AAC.1
MRLLRRVCCLRPVGGQGACCKGSFRMRRAAGGLGGGECLRPEHRRQSALGASACTAAGRRPLGD